MRTRVHLTWLMPGQLAPVCGTARHAVLTECRARVTCTRCRRRIAKFERLEAAGHRTHSVSRHKHVELLAAAGGAR